MKEGFRGGGKQTREGERQQNQNGTEKELAGSAAESGVMVMVGHANARGVTETARAVGVVVGQGAGPTQRVRLVNVLDQPNVRGDERDVVALGHVQILQSIRG